MDSSTLISANTISRLTMTLALFSLFMQIFTTQVLCVCGMCPLDRSHRHGTYLFWRRRGTVYEGNVTWRLFLISFITPTQSSTTSSTSSVVVTPKGLSQSGIIILVTLNWSLKSRPRHNELWILILTLATAWAVHNCMPLQITIVMLTAIEIAI